MICYNGLMRPPGHGKDKYVRNMLLVHCHNSCILSSIKNCNNSHSDKKYIAIFSNKLIIKVYRINTVFGCYCLRRRDIDIKKQLFFLPHLDDGPGKTLSMKIFLIGHTRTQKSSIQNNESIPI